MLELRALNPETDRELFELAYNWRPKTKKHVQPDRMPFEDFAASDPTQIVMGLFNGHLQAVYLIREWEHGKFETHFTSDRAAPKENVIAGARKLLTWLVENGAVEVSAWVMERNRAIRRFVEATGFVAEKNKDQEFGSVRFVKYVCKGAN